MKTLLLLICFSTLVSPVFAELSDADLDKIRLIVKEEIKSEITASEKRMKEYVDVKINGLDQRLSSRMSGLEKNIDMLSSFTFALIALIVVAIGIPQIIIAWRNAKDNSLEKQLQKQIDELSEKIPKEMS